MTESSDASDTPAKPQDYAGFAHRISHARQRFRTLINEPWPRLEGHAYRWQLHSYGLVEGYDKLVVADIIVLLIEALRGIGAANNKLTHAHIKADDHNPGSPYLIAPARSAVSNFPIG
jgi:hypothetical protein